MSDNKVERKKSNVCFLRRGERTFGPLTPQELRAKYDAGKLQPTDQVSENETGPWRFITDIKGIVFKDGIEIEDADSEANELELTQDSTCLLYTSDAADE